MALFAVTTMRGAVWENDRGIREQPQLADHAEFADRLVEDGRIVLEDQSKTPTTGSWHSSLWKHRTLPPCTRPSPTIPGCVQGIPCAQGCPAVDDLASRRQGVDTSRTTCREHRAQRRWASGSGPSEHRQGTDPSPAWDRPRPAERSALYKCRSVPPRAQAKLGILRAHFGHAHRRLMSSLLGSSHLGGQSGHHQVVGVFDQVP